MLLIIIIVIVVVVTYFRCKQYRTRPHHVPKIPMYIIFGSILVFQSQQIVL